MSDSLRPHGPQHTRLPCPSLSPGVCLNSCPSNRWCHPTISSSVTPSPPVFNLSQHQGLFQRAFAFIYVTLCTFLIYFLTSALIAVILDIEIRIFFLIYFNWRLITLKYCGGFCHTLTWSSHRCAWVPRPEPPPTSLPIPPLWVVPVQRLWGPCFMHRTWTGGSLCVASFVN